VVLQDVVLQDADGAAMPAEPPAMAENLCDKIIRLKARKLELKAEQKLKAAQLKKDEKRMRRIKESMKNLSQVDIAECLALRIAAPKPKPKAKAKAEAKAMA
jgi:hypothetical protein